MIIEISIENYLSIKEKVVLSLDPSASKKLSQNLIELPEKERILKSAVIYGANASGKSNIIKGIFFLWNMVRSSHNFNINMKIPRVPFKLDKFSLDKPSKFEVVFIHKNIKYKYGFSCDNERIIDEYLYYWPHGREALIFSRTKSKEFTFTEDKKQQKLIKKQMNENVLYLSRATQLGYEKTKNAFEFIVDHVMINYSPNWTELTIRDVYENSKLKKKIIDILQKADFGGIIDIKVEKDKRKVDGFEFKIEKDHTIFNPISQKEEEFFDVKFIHEDDKKNPVKFNIAEESHGTRKTLAMLGPIFEVLRTGKTLFIDEFELNLHPNITEFLIKLFHSKHNKNNGQLIITTHDTTLLKNKNLFRRDQVYICSKAPNKWTELNSLTDFDLRESLSFENAYLNGRVGGLPFIDETFLDD